MKTIQRLRRSSTVRPDVLFVLCCLVLAGMYFVYIPTSTKMKTVQPKPVPAKTNTTLPVLKGVCSAFRYRRQEAKRNTTLTGPKPTN